MTLVRQRVGAAYRELYNTYGPQEWWPGESRFEIMVGAVLTQNASWRNVELVLRDLKSHSLLSPRALLSTRRQTLARILRPAIYYNTKAERLRALCRFIIDHGGIRRLGSCPTQDLRRALLEVSGIGPETADAMLLYAFSRPVFVIDAYTRRLCSRLGWISGGEPYEWMRAGFERALDQDHAVYNEFHALIVHHGKQVCRTRPRCADCCLRRRCRYARAARK